MSNPGVQAGSLIAFLLLGIACVVLYVRRDKTRAAQQAAAARRITAIDNGQRCRLLLSVRGTYGDYGRKWFSYIAYLEPARFALRPGLLPGSRRRTITITEPILSAHERPFLDDAEKWRLNAPGYAGTGLQRLVITCQTPEGTLEFGVRRSDMPLLLHYLQQRGTK